MSIQARLSAPYIQDELPISMSPPVLKFYRYPIQDID